MKGQLENKATPPAAPGQPYAIHPDELASRTAAGGPAPRQPAAQEWRWIILAGVAVVALLLYTRAWPALGRLIYRPSPVRDYLLPPSPRPLYVIAGVGVGWFWVLFIAAPIAAAAVSLLWWAPMAWSNHRARTGDLGHVRPGQRWQGQRYPTGPLIVAAAAVLLSAFGTLLRWAGPAAMTLPGRGLLVAVGIVAGWGFTQFARWAYARGTITGQINTITYLSAPALSWRDLRAGRVKAVRCCYPRKEPAFPKVVKLHYGQHPRAVTDEVIAEIAGTLEQVTGRFYRFDHDPLTRTLSATETVAPSETDTVTDAEAVLAPLVAAWFDPAAQITSVTVTPQPAADSGGATEDCPPTAEEHKTPATGNDTIAERIADFSIEFVYNLKVSTPYRRGVIESAVCDTLRGSWEADWSMPSRRVRFIRCPGLPTLVDPPLEFPAITRSTIRKLYTSTAIPFAVDAYGNTISWDFKLSPHMLIAGATASGKTSLLMTITTQCARRGFNVVWIDPKGFDSPGLRDHPNVSLVTSGFDDDGMVSHTAALRFIADTMRDRLSQVKINPNRANDFDPIIVVTDEFSNLIMELSRLYLRYKNTKIDKGRPPTEEDVGTILRTARAVGIHMAIGIQRPDTTFIAGEARDNTTLRVSMGRLRSKEFAMMMFNDPTAGTRLQPGIKGRGTVQLPDGGFREIQVFYTPVIPATDQQRAALSDHERSILAELSAVDSFWPRRVVDSALRGYDSDDSDSVMSFKQIRESPIVPAAARPDLDPLSDHYEAPVGAVRRPTMDDADGRGDDTGYGPPEPADGGQSAGAPFGGPVDGFPDDYLPGVDDEYGPPIPMSAHELSYGDLVDVSIDGVGDWRYVHAEPYLTDDVDGSERFVIPYRDENGQNIGDIEVEPHTVFQARQLLMQ